MLIRCDVPAWANSTLSLQPKGMNETIYNLSVDNEKIRLISKNVFNITNLAYNDSGDYMCESDMLEEPNTASRVMTRYRLIVIKKGKTCLRLLSVCTSFYPSFTAFHSKAWVGLNSILSKVLYKSKHACFNFIYRMTRFPEESIFFIEQVLMIYKS